MCSKRGSETVEDWSRGFVSDKIAMNVFTALVPLTFRVAGGELPTCIDFVRLT
jgi:hypothetical protein